MKKKVLAALLAVCMILSTCVLYASAAGETVPVGTILIKEGTTYKKATKGTDYEIAIKVSAKESPKGISKGADTLTSSEIDNIFDFKKSSSNTPVKYKGEIENTLSLKYTIVKGTDSAKVTIVGVSYDTEMTNLYKVTKDFSYGGTDEPTSLTAAVKDDNIEAVTGQYKYSLENANASVNASVSLAAKLHTVTTGVRFFGANSKNLVANEIAKVTVYVHRDVYGNNDKGEPIYKKAVSDTISDLADGDLVYFETQLKDADNQKFYAFNCWINGSNEVQEKGENKPIGDFDVHRTKVYTVSGDIALYANYVEIVDRHTISFSCEGEGAIVYADGEKSIANREVFTGEGQVSVLDGRDAYFTFTPKEGYEVAHVYVDGEKDVTSFLTLVTSGNILDALQELIKAGTVTTEGVKASGTYTFKKVDKDHTIHVVFQKAQVLDAPSGKDLPTVAAEGITLATGADAENGDGENGGATTVPAEDGAAANGGSAASGVVNPATGSTGAIAVFATLSVAACAAFVTAKKKED